MDSQKKTRPRILALLFWLLVPLLVWLAVKDAPFREILETLRNLGPFQLLALVAINIAIFAMLTGRWWVVLRSVRERVPFLMLIRYRLAAFGISYFTPGPQFGGEPLQVYYLNRRHRVPFTTAASAVALDKLVEVLANFIFLAFGVETILRIGLLPDANPVNFLLISLGLVALPLFYLLALWMGYHPLAQLLGARPLRWAAARIPPSVIASASTAEHATGDLFRRYPRVLLSALLISGITWAAMGLEFWLAANFLGLRLSFYETIAAITAARVAFLLPMPGGLGTLEASQVFAMGMMGYPAAFGVSISLLIRARDVTFGMIGLWAGGLFPPLRRWAPRVFSPIYLIDRVSKRRGRQDRWSD